MRGAARRLVPQGDGGSILPLITVFVLIVVLMIIGMMASTAAFIAQQSLQSTCDSAAIWAAAEADTEKVYSGKVSKDEYLPLSPEAVAAAVREHQARFYADDPQLRLSTATEGDVLLVKCHTRAKIPFGGAFGKGEGIDRDTESAVRSPLSRPRSEVSIVPDDPAGDYAMSNTAVDN